MGRPDDFLDGLPDALPIGQRQLFLPGPILRVPSGRKFACIDRSQKRLFLLDGELDPKQDGALPGLPDHSPLIKGESCMVASDMAVVVLTVDRVVCVDPDGRPRWTLPHPPWPGSHARGAGLLFNRSLAVAVPAVPAPPRWSQVPSVDLVAVDLISGEIKQRTRLMDEAPEGFHAVVRRDGQSGLLDGGFGQDGSHIWKVWESQDKVHVDLFSRDDRVLGDISPSGEELLTTPHRDESLVIYRWNDLSEVARVDGAPAFGRRERNQPQDPDGFDYSAWYLSNALLLSVTRQGRLLIVDRVDLKPRHRLRLAGYEPIGYDKRGRRVDHPSEAVDFATDLTEVTVVDDRRIIAHRRDGRADLFFLD